MADKVKIELSKDLYQEFSGLKETISLMAKDQISDEDLVGFMVQEISASLELMAKDGAEGHDHKHDDGHSCCGGGNCGS